MSRQITEIILAILAFRLLFTERNVLTVHSLRIVRNVLMVTFVDGAATTQIQVLVSVKPMLGSQY